MKKIAFLVVAAFASCFAPAEVVDGVAAKINGTIITFGDVLNEIHRSPSLSERFSEAAANDPAQLAVLYTNTVELLIDRKLILMAAAEKKMDIQEWVIDNRVREIIKENFHGERSELDAALQKAHQPFEEWRTNIREDLIIGSMRYQIVEKYVQPSPEMMNREYKNNPERYTEEAKATVRVILLKPGKEGEPSVQDRAKNIFEALADSRIDFGMVARNYSADSHAKDGGLWKDVKPEEAFRPEIAEVIDALEIGACSKLIDLDGWGFIVKKEAATQKHLRTFADAYDDIAWNVRRAESGKAHKAWLTRLRADAFIKINPMPNGK